MYDLPYHKEENPQVIKAFIDQYPFAFLVGCQLDGVPVATQVPIFIENQTGKQVLRGHIMKHTDHHRAFHNNEQVLVVFTGRNTYVSGTWYSDPHMPSTWNYMSVHVKGRIRFLDQVGLEDVLRTTTLHFEKGNHESTTLFENIPEAFKSRVMHAIIGFEIEIEDIDTVFKLSQDRDYVSYHHIIQKLQQQDIDGQVIASEMQKRSSQLFPKGQ